MSHQDLLAITSLVFLFALIITGWTIIVVISAAVSGSDKRNGIIGAGIILSACLWTVFYYLTH